MLTNIICIIIIGFQVDTIRNLEKNMISLAPGTALPELELAPVSQLTSQLTISETKRVKLIFIFQSPCSACNANLNAWKKLALYFEGKIDIRGIVLDGEMEAQRLLEKEPLHFELYVPEYSRHFREQMHIKLNMAQTIVASDDKIVFLRLGNLSYEDIDELIRLIKTALKKA